MPNETFSVHFKVNTKELDKLDTKLKKIDSSQSNVIKALSRRSDIYNKGLEAVGEKSVQISNRTLEGQKKIGDKIESNMQKRRTALTAQTSMQKQILTLGNEAIAVENKLTAAKEKNIIASDKKLKKERDILDVERRRMANEKRKVIRKERKSAVAQAHLDYDQATSDINRIGLKPSTTAAAADLTQSKRRKTAAEKIMTQYNVGSGDKINRVAKHLVDSSDDEVRKSLGKSKTFGKRKQVGSKAENELMDDLLNKNEKYKQLLQKEAELKQVIRGIDKGIVILKKAQTEAQKKTNQISRETAKSETRRISQLKSSADTQKERNSLERMLAAEGEKISKNATKLIAKRDILLKSAQKEYLSKKDQNRIDQALIKNADQLQQTMAQTTLISKKQKDLQKQELQHARDIEKLHRKDTETLREQNRIRNRKQDEIGDSGSGDASIKSSILSMQQLKNEAAKVKKEIKDSENFLEKVNAELKKSGNSEKRIADLMRSKNTLQSQLIGLKKTENAVNGNISKVLERQGKNYKLMQQNFTQFRQVFFTGAIIAGAGLGVLSKVVKDAGDAEKAIKALNRQARLSNVFGDRTGDTVKNLDIVQQGLVSIADTSKAIRNLMRLGFSFDEAVASTKQITEIAIENKQSALSLGQAIVSTTEGFRQELSVLADAGGITKNLSVIYSEFAATLGKTGKSLTRSEKNMALMHEISLESAISAGALDTVMNTLSGSVDATGGSITILSQAIGESLRPAITSALKVFVSLIKEVTAFVQENKLWIGALGSAVTVLGLVATAIAGVLLGILGLKGSLLAVVVALEFFAINATKVTTAMVPFLTSIGLGTQANAALAVAATESAAAITATGVASAGVTATMSGLLIPFLAVAATVAALTGGFYLLNASAAEGNMTFGEMSNAVTDLTQELALGAEALSGFQENIDDLSDSVDESGLDALKDKMKSFSVVQENLFLKLRLDAVKTKASMQDFWNSTNKLMRENIALSSKMLLPKLEAERREITSRLGGNTPVTSDQAGAISRGFLGQLSERAGTGTQFTGPELVAKLKKSLLEEGTGFFESGPLKLNQEKEIFNVLSRALDNKALIALKVDKSSFGASDVNPNKDQIRDFHELMQSFSPTTPLENINAKIAEAKKAGKGEPENPNRKPAEFAISKTALSRTSSLLKGDNLLNGKGQALHQIKGIIADADKAILSTDKIIKELSDKTSNNGGTIEDLKRLENEQNRLKSLKDILGLFQKAESDITAGRAFEFNFDSPDGDQSTIKVISDADANLKTGVKDLGATLKAVSDISIKLKKAEKALAVLQSKADAKLNTKQLKRFKKLNDKSAFLNANVIKDNEVVKIDNLIKALDTKQLDKDIIKLTATGKDAIPKSKVEDFRRNVDLQITLRDIYNDSVAQAVKKIDIQTNKEISLASKLDKLDKAKAVKKALTDKIAKLGDLIQGERSGALTDKTKGKIQEKISSARTKSNKSAFEVIELVHQTERLSLKKQINALTGSDIDTKKEKLRLQKELFVLNEKDLENLKSEEGLDKVKKKKLEEKLITDQDGLNTTIKQGQKALKIAEFKNNILDKKIQALKNLKKGSKQHLELLKEVAALERELKIASAGSPALEKASRGFLEKSRKTRTSEVEDSLKPKFGIQGTIRQLEAEREAHKKLLEAGVEDHAEFEERKGEITKKINMERRRLEDETAVQLKQSFVDSYMGIIDGTKSFGDMLFDIFKTMADKINKMMIEQAIEQSFIGGLFESIAGGISGSFGNKASKSNAAPAGGLVAAIRGGQPTTEALGLRGNRSTAPIYNINMKIDAVDGASLRRVFQSPEAQQSIASTVMVTSEKNKIPLGN